MLLRTTVAQSGTRRRIAYLDLGGSDEPFLDAFRQGLRALGYGDADFAIETRYADGHAERLPDLAAELVRLAPEVIVGLGAAPVKAAKQATAAIPIVMVEVADPIGLEFVASLAHPGGNVTGMANLAAETLGKRMQLLKAPIPDAERIAILSNPGNVGNILQRQLAQESARTLGIEPLSVEARAPAEIDGAFDTMIRERASALIVLGDNLFILEMSRIVELAASHRLPAVYQFREYAAIGGLMSYGADAKDDFRQAAGYVDKILRGAKPADLPVEQPTKFDLVVNLKTAQALGLTIPPAILAGAGEVIE